jgi:hypothetical protein
MRSVVAFGLALGAVVLLGQSAEAQRIRNFWRCSRKSWAHAFPSSCEVH